MGTVVLTEVETTACFVTRWKCVHDEGSVATVKSAVPVSFHQGVPSTGTVLAAPLGFAAAALFPSAVVGTTIRSLAWGRFLCKKVRGQSLAKGCWVWLIGHV
jgi:hypothetical protein